jgi:hypothetical protein
MIVLGLQKAVSKIRSLPAGQKEAFTSSFVKGTNKLAEHQDVLTASRRAIPAELPKALVQPTF